MIGELSLRDEDFRRWWATHLVVSPTCDCKTFLHPQVGKISLDWQIVSCAESPDQAIIGLTAAPGSATDEALNRLTAGIFPRNAKRPMQCTGRFEGETSVDRFQNQPGYLVW